MDAQDYINEVRAKKRWNLIIGIVIAVIIALTMLPRLFEKEPDLNTALAQMPRLALTQAEKDLADTLLEPETFRSALSYDALTVTTFTLDEVQDIIAPVLPEDAEVMEISVNGAVVCIDYISGDLRVILEYVDPDRSGSVDHIRKAVAPLESQPEPFAPKSQGFYQITYNIRTGETKLLESMEF